MIFCVASGVAFILAIVFQCQLISHAWNRDFKGQCIHYNSVAWGNGGVNILQDILIVLLPVSELQILQLSTRKKVGVYTMFGLGLMYVSFSLLLCHPCQSFPLIRIRWFSVCILSIIRLWSLQTFGLTADPTWDNLPTTFWSTLETTAAVTCACMPPIRGGFMRLFREWQDFQRQAGSEA